jgi:hypothetical protein
MLAWENFPVCRRPAADTIWKNHISDSMTNAFFVMLSNIYTKGEHMGYLVVLDYT